MNREDKSVIDYIVELSGELAELKNAQIFGGDALHLNEYTAELPYQEDDVLIYLTLTPSDPKVGVLPSSCNLRWTNTNMNSQMMYNYQVMPVYDASGVFKWKIVGENLEAFKTYVTLQYIGDGTVTLTRVS